MTCGPVSSIFDFATFGVLMLLLHAGAAEFRTGWFIESILSASGIVLVIRTRRPFLKSKPSWQLAATTAAVAVATLVLPYTPLGALMRLVPLPARFFGPLAAILALYVLTAEFAKRLFYRANP